MLGIYIFLNGLQDGSFVETIILQDDSLCRPSSKNRKARSRVVHFQGPGVVCERLEAFEPFKAAFASLGPRPKGESRKRKDKERQELRWGVRCGP